MHVNQEIKFVYVILRGEKLRFIRNQDISKLVVLIRSDFLNGLEFKRAEIMVRDYFTTMQNTRDLPFSKITVSGATINTSQIKEQEQHGLSGIFLIN